MSTTDNQVVGMCNSLEACELTGENSNAAPRVEIGSPFPRLQVSRKVVDKSDRTVARARFAPEHVWTCLKMRSAKCARDCGQGSISEEHRKQLACSECRIYGVESASWRCANVGRFGSMPLLWQPAVTWHGRCSEKWLGEEVPQRRGSSSSKKVARSSIHPSVHSFVRSSVILVHS